MRLNNFNSPVQPVLKPIRSSHPYKASLSPIPQFCDKQAPSREPKPDIADKILSGIVKFFQAIFSGFADSAHGFYPHHLDSHKDPSKDDEQ